jgi:hypothetical protein
VIDQVVETNMFQPRRRASLLLAASAFLVVAAPASAQAGPPDGVARNLLERQQRETDFHVRLYDNAPPKPMASSPSLPLPLETSPRSQLDLGGLPANPTANQPITPQVPDAGQRRQLEVSQQQRLQQLQLQNKNLDEPVRQQQTQIQQLQFDRENQAQSLHDQILRDSQGAMRQVR